MWWWCVLTENWNISLLELNTKTQYLQFQSATPEQTATELPRPTLLSATNNTLFLTCVSVMQSKFVYVTKRKVMGSLSLWSVVLQRLSSMWTPSTSCSLLFQLRIFKDNFWSAPALHCQTEAQIRTRNWRGQKRNLWPILRHCCSICLGLKYENLYTIRSLEAEVSKRRLLNNEAGMLTRSMVMFILKVSHLGTFCLDP